MVDNHVTIIFTVPGHIINKNQPGDFYAQKCSCPNNVMLKNVMEVFVSCAQ